ncbi:MAG TPA: radical SAM protein, partial [Candidatus Binatia bacterium]|nr:radical SAM protein [Candidatus Binatia bacterium]
LLDLIAQSKIVCPHLHICAQAGDDEILRRMRRNYDKVCYRDLLQRVRERLPDAALGSDIIVGFPGETDAQFDMSVEFFASLPLTYFHVFPFSTRRGTPAASMPDLVPAGIKKIRARRMRELGAQKKRDFCTGFVGRRASVLVETKVDAASGLHRGFSRNYLPVAVSGAHGLANREVEVRLDGFQNGWLNGEPVGLDSEFLACDRLPADLP